MSFIQPFEENTIIHILPRLNTILTMAVNTNLFRYTSSVKILHWVSVKQG